MGVRTKSEVYNAELPKLLASGASLSEVAQRFCVSVEAIRNAKDRRGLSFKHEIHRDTDIRAMIEGLPDDDCIDFLLEFIEQMRSAMSVVDTEVIDRLGLSFLEARLLNALVGARGKVVSKESLYSALYYDRGEDDLPEPKIIQAHISRLRAKLPAEVGVIETVSVFGYRLDAGG